MMTPKIIFLWLSMLQHFPPPPPPSGFGLQSFVIETVDDGEIDYGDNNKLFKRLVNGNDTLQGLSGFCDVWEGIVRDDPIITQLNKNNWKKLINYVNKSDSPIICSGNEITLSAVCREAYEYNNDFIFDTETKCAGQYNFLPIQRELYLFLILSFIFILITRNYSFKVKI